METARAHLFIEGRVQGVFFRAFTREVALALGLHGWVKNLRDGRVEAVFEGDKERIRQAINQCHAGPPGSRVTHIDTHWETFTGDESGFHIRY